MGEANSTLTILDDVLYFDLDKEIDGPTSHRLTDCMLAIEPAVDTAAENFGIGTTTTALIALAVNLAIDSGDSAGLADVLRQNAETLDSEAQVGFVEGSV
jgi:hypothetical protein